MTMPTARRYHWYAVLIFIIGTLFPPLAVAARFGIGKDFWLNLLLTIAGYIPGHAHNFYIQNIRNNKTHQRTPKWALRYGLVDGSTIRRHERRSQWAGKYNDRNPDSGYDHQSLEEGQVGPSETAAHDAAHNPPSNRDGLWRPDDESYYSSEHEASLQSPASDGRWRYLPNFNDSLAGAGEQTIKKKKKKKDRWARTEDAYSASDQKKRRKKSKHRSTVADVDSTYSHRTESTAGLEVPEEATAGALGGQRQGDSREMVGNEHVGGKETEFNHEF